MSLNAPSAAAVAHCVSARLMGGTSRRHPEPCGWCDYPLENLQEMLAAFDVGARESREFRNYPVRRQRQYVIAAQGFDDTVTEQLHTSTADPADGGT